MRVLQVHSEVHGRGNTRTRGRDEVLVSFEVRSRRRALETLHSNSGPKTFREHAYSELSFGFLISFFFLRFLSIEKVILSFTYALSLT